MVTKGIALKEVIMQVSGTTDGLTPLEKLQEDADKAVEEVRVAFAKAESLERSGGCAWEVRRLFQKAARSEKAAAKAMRALLRGHLDVALLPRSEAPSVSQPQPEVDDDFEDDGYDSYAGEESWDDDD